MERFAAWRRIWDIIKCYHDGGARGLDGVVFITYISTCKAGKVECVANTSCRYR